MPNNQKKLLIAYATAGSGHRRAAEALYNYLKSDYAHQEVKIVDILDYTNFFFRIIYSSGYAFIVKNFPFVWFVFYRLTDKYGHNRFSKKFSSLITALCTKGFKRFLLEYQPEIILATHFLVSEVTAAIKKSGMINSQIVTVITDFDIHPFWVAPEIDLYSVGSIKTREKLLKFGITHAQIIVSGIPVDLKFTKTYQRLLICEKLTLSSDKFTVLVMMAGFGLGPIEKIVNLLEGCMQLLVVCGKNERLYRRLKRRPNQTTKIFGFIDNIEELMAVADVIITKPGGLTVSESLAMNLPMIFVAPIYGQETANAKFLTQHGLGIVPANLTEIKRIILEFKNDPNKLARIKGNISEFKKPYALKEICDALC